VGGIVPLISGAGSTLPEKNRRDPPLLEKWNQQDLIDPRGSFVAEGSRVRTGVIIGEIDWNLISEVMDQWQFYRDRRPKTYNQLML
jgi:hypothetical protein